MGSVVAQPLYRLYTGWTVSGSNPIGRRDFLLPSRTTVGPTKPPVLRVPGLPGDKTAEVWR